MKLTKKAAALLLAASLAVSVCATPVFAEGGGTGTTPDTPSETGSETETTVNTDVTYTVDTKYTWTIPAKIDFGSNAGIKKTRTVKANTAENIASKAATNDIAGTAPMVCVTENIITPGDALKISIDTDSSSFENGHFYVGVHGTGTIEKLSFKINKLAEDDAAGDELNASKSEVLRVPSGTKTGKQALVLALNTTTGEVEKAGAYTGAIVFKSEVSSAKT